jgi:hypothetical protein
MADKPASMTTAEFSERQRALGRIPRTRAPNDPASPYEKDPPLKAESDYQGPPKPLIDARKTPEPAHPWKPESPAVKPAEKWTPAPPKGH